MRDLGSNHWYTFDGALLDHNRHGPWLAKKGQRQNINALRHTSGSLNNRMQTLITRTWGESVTINCVLK